MHSRNSLAGVYAAALTPLQADFTPDPDGLTRLLDFLARRGCDGALLLGTTGEGPSFAPAERQEIWRLAARIRQVHPGFRLLAGTGTPSLTETIALTRAAFELDFDGVVVLPPYYFRKVTDEGLFGWYSQVIRAGVPEGKAFLGYHIPPVSEIPLSPDLLARLKDAFPKHTVGIKDSSGDPEQARALGQRFGSDLLILNGTDRLFSLALENRASGCITALANLFSPDLRRVWDAFQQGTPDRQAQERLDRARTISERYPPAAPLFKAIMAQRFDFPEWPVRLPLLPAEQTLVAQALAEFEDLF